MKGNDQENNTAKAVREVEYKVQAAWKNMPKCHFWWRRLPSTLKSPFLRCLVLLDDFSEVGYIAGVLTPKPETGFDSVECEATEVYKVINELRRDFANRFLPASVHVSKLNDELYLTTDEFAAVNEGIVNWKPPETSSHGTFKASSWHQLVHIIASTWIENTLKTICFKKDENDYEVVFRPSAEDCSPDKFLKYISDEALSVTRSFNFEDYGDFYREMQIRLIQEVSRAYDRRLLSGRSHPEDEIPLEPLLEHNFVTQIDYIGPKRPAYHRDHTWLSWYLKDRLTPAKIRDRWNSLSDDERISICYTASNKIGSSEDGRDVVKKAIDRARKELGNYLNL